MLLGLPARDVRVIVRGLAALILAVAVGVTAVEHQLNQLTGSGEVVGILNLGRDDGGRYHACVFGHSAAVRAVYPIGRIAGDARSVTVEAAGVAVTLPTCFSVDCSPAAYWLREWRRQFVAAALATKKEIARYAEEIAPLLRRAAGGIGR